MTEKIELQPSEGLAYLVGVAQADGYLKRLLWKGEEKVGLDFGVSEKSLPMLEKFRDLSNMIFGRKISIWKDKRGYGDITLVLNLYYNNLEIYK